MLLSLFYPLIAVGTGLLLAGIATAVASLIGGIATNASNERSVEETNAANANLWREQTAYNDPSNVMQRFKKAGLNPNLISGNSLSGTASQAPQMLASQKQNPVPQIDPKTWAEIDNINKDTELKEQKIAESKSVVDLNNSTVFVNGEKLKIDKNLSIAQIQSISENLKLIQPTIDKINSEIRLTDSQVKNLDEQTRGLISDNAFKDATFKDRVRECAAQADLTEQQVKNLIQQYLYNPRLFEAQIAMQLAEGRNLNSLADMNEQEFKEFMSSDAISSRLAAMHHEKIVNLANNSKAGIAIESFGRVISALSPFIPSGTYNLSSNPVTPARGKK